MEKNRRLLFLLITIILLIIITPIIFKSDEERFNDALKRGIIKGLIVSFIGLIYWTIRRFIISDKTKIKEANDFDSSKVLFKQLFKDKQYKSSFLCVEDMYEKYSSDTELNIMYLSIVPFIRAYSGADIKLLDTMIESFYKMDKQEKMKHAIIPYIRGYYYHSIGNKEMAEDYKSETYEAEPYFDSKYPEYINNLKY